MSTSDFYARRRTLRVHDAIYAFKDGIIGLGRRATDAIGTWNRRRADRAAFMNLLEKEEWVYRDMGIHRGDVEWAARLPLHINASRELEKLRARNMQGR
jgi:hypothetical protein